ncbi:MULTISPECIES: helix-turn-helix domain-containing protein [unclassified Raoultella]|uniref:winged helix-turn-helix transcriptional regulator n=1 Tax=unclassified Raoultella TaxID=2627600 RepID=UPI001359BF96|nr:MULTISPECIES: helix-turn-helix domain-containing protein [unclassified Raoultella]
MAKTAAQAAENNFVPPVCPMTSFVNLIAGKWAIPVLYRLIVLNAPLRFGELLRAIAPITQKELTRQLRLFEQRGLVSRRVYPEIPPRVEYQITELGLSMREALQPLAEWMNHNSHRLKR